MAIGTRNPAQLSLPAADHSHFAWWQFRFPTEPGQMQTGLGELREGHRAPRVLWASGSASLSVTRQTDRPPPPAGPHFCIQAGSAGSGQETGRGLCLEPALPLGPAHCHVRLIGAPGHVRPQLPGTLGSGAAGNKTQVVRRGVGVGPAPPPDKLDSRTCRPHLSAATPQ